jgi:hypothetical protein
LSISIFFIIFTKSLLAFEDNDSTYSVIHSNNQLNQSLIRFIKNGRINDAIYLIKNGINLLEADSSGFTANYYITKSESSKLASEYSNMQQINNLALENVLFKKKLFNLINKAWKIFLYCIIYYFVINIKICMYQPITHTDDLNPGNIMMIITVLLRNLRSSFTDNFNRSYYCL